MTLPPMFHPNSAAINHSPYNEKSKKIKENQEEYDKKILASPFNVNDWLSIHPGNDKLGPYGEFLTTKKAVNACKETTTYFKILNNLYINTDKGSTEIDVLMIHETGIYVFESKIFSGQIYGEYKQKNGCNI